MTLTLTLTPEKQTRLQEQADRAGLSLDDYVQRVIDETADEAPSPTAAPPERTLAEMLAGHVGTVASGCGDLSQDTGKRFTQIVQEKHKARRL